jgi:hypothetical protein
LTIRLPDISTPRELGQNLSHSPDDALPAGTATAEGSKPSHRATKGLAASLASFDKPWQRTTDALRRRASSFGKPWPRTTDLLRQRVIPFVRQPRFWLACITAIGVQVVLAAVMTPAEDDHRDEIRTAAKAWPKPAPVPAERIVVPPAQGPHDLLDPPDHGKHGTTTPLGSTAHLDSPADATGATAAADTDGVDDTSAQVRVAENRRLDDGRQFDRQFEAGPGEQADGATLGGIVPLGPMHESNLQEPRR